MILRVILSGNNKQGMPCPVIPLMKYLIMLLFELMTPVLYWRREDTPTQPFGVEMHGMRESLHKSKSRRIPTELLSPLSGPLAQLRGFVCFASSTPCLSISTISSFSFIDPSLELVDIALPILLFTMRCASGRKVSRSRFQV